jgi:integrase
MSWSRFAQFANAHSLQVLPASSRTIVAFAARMFERGYSPATIASHLSAVAYYHKLYSDCDPTDTFIVRKLIQGARKLRPASDGRLPITKDILLRLINSLKFVTSSPYDQSMLSAMFCLAFYGFLRIGEITGSSANVLSVSNVSVVTTCIYIRFDHFKHHAGQPITIVVNSSSHPCPVKALNHYLTLRGYQGGPLFAFPGLKHLPRAYFTNMLHCCLTYLGLNPAQYKSHSFRIGAATHAALLGLSDSEIQALGRWKSGAFKKYIRLPCVSF